MSGTKYKEPKQITKTKAPIQVQPEQTLREHLTSLQTWDSSTQTTVADQQARQRNLISQQQRNKNLTLQAGIAKQLPTVTATQTAPGTPGPVQAPAKETRKEKRERKRRAKEANKKVAGADHISYDIQANAKGRMDQVSNSVDAYGEEELVATGVDMRVLRTLCTGYKKDKKGRPLNPEEAAKKERDMIALNDYSSKDIRRRRPYLDKMVADIQSYTFSADMFEGEQFGKNISKLKDMGDRMVYFQNMQKDPVNKPYFDSMDPIELQAIDAKLDAIAAAFSSQIVNKSTMKGVALDHAHFVDSSEVMEVAGTMDQVYEGFFQEGLLKVDKAKDAHLDKLVARELTQEPEIAQDIKTKRKEEGLGLTSFAPAEAYEALSNGRALIESNQELYQASKPAVDKLYQEMYRSVDALGGLTAESSALQRTLDLCRTKEKDSSYYGELSQKAEARLTAMQANQDSLQTRIHGLSDALEFYVTTKPMTPLALNTLKEVESFGGDKHLFADAAVKKSFLGENGALTKSNEAYAQALKRGESKETGRAGALVAMSIRNSSTDASKSDKLMQNDAFSNVLVEILDMMKGFEHQGVDMSLAVQESLHTGQCTTGKVIDAMTTQMMEITQKALTSPESIDYLVKMHKAIGHADVFEGSVHESVQYLVQGLVNSHMANANVVATHKEELEQPVASVRMATDVARTMMKLAVLMRNQNSLDEQPKHIKNLVSTYSKLVDTLTEKVTAAL